MSDPNSNGKIKIAHIVNSLGVAGKELGILKLIDHMNRERFDSSIVVLNQVYFDKIGALLSQYQVIHLDEPPGNHPGLPLKLARLFRENRFDIIHTHSWGTLLEGVLGAKLAGVRAVIHGEHGTFPEKFPHRVIQRLFWRMTDGVLSVSDVLGKKLSEVTRFDNRRIQVILNGVDASKFYPSAELRRTFRERFQFREAQFVVGTVGRLHRIKNNPMVVRGLAHLRAEGQTVEFAHVGGGDFADKLGAEWQTLANSLGVGSHLHLLGYQSEMNMVYNGFDVFTLTSFSEGCSNVIQEAMFAGKPVIATRVGGNSELVQHGVTGFLVESDNDREWAEAVGKLYRDRALLEKMSHNARAFAMENFSVEKMAAAYERMYLAAYRKNGK